jgi:hypothetical protein
MEYKAQYESREVGPHKWQKLAVQVWLYIT